MNLYLECFFALALAVIIGYYGTKIYEIYNSKVKFRTVKDEFCCDLYKIQKKWIKRGCYDYYNAIGVVLEGVNLPDEPIGPETQAGRQAIMDLETIAREDNY